MTGNVTRMLCGDTLFNIIQTGLANVNFDFDQCLPVFTHAIEIGNRIKKITRCNYFEEYIKPNLNYVTGKNIIN